MTLSAQGGLARAAVAVARRLARVRFRGIPRILYTVSPWVIGRGTRVIECTTGMRLALDITDYASCMMVFGRFSSDIVALIERLIRPGDVVVDVGAQLGYITTLLARQVGRSGHVYGFEPDPNALAKLRVTLMANDLPQVTLFEMAAGDRTGELTFNVSPTLGWSTAVPNTHLTGLQTIRVPVTTLDESRATGRIKGRIRFVKVDVEGFESAVFDGAQRLFAEDRPLILTEINPLLLRPLGQTSVDALARIVRHDYAVFRVDQPSGLLSGGTVRLVEVDAARPMDVCDVLCVPRDQVSLVRGLL